ncbi:MAG: hypothetical protein V4724_26495 [Pseudomonadota bacterium]
MIALIFAVAGAAGWSTTEVVAHKPVQAVREVRKLLLVGGTDVAERALADQVAQIEARRVAVAPGQTEFTVAQFCAARGLTLVMADMQRMGKAAAKFSRQHGLTIGRAADELFGEVNAYCAVALEDALDAVGAAEVAHA